ncbi:MAG: 3-phosphoserine/phosphohydroxythreonine transaminase [Hahellaceae bacterium]|nr:3-phosphoserine/phosphohydroxythreonine transaminase [Hahellaceae bacterium]
MARVFNFCAGPAALPTEVLQQAQAELVDWRGKGLSIMEMSHRSDEFVAVAEEAEKDFRDLLSISDDYAVLFLQGGATGQFSAVPLNLLGNAASADYINTGIWSKKAIAEAKRYTSVNVAASTESENFMRVPTQAELRLTGDAAYVHYTPNETIGGLEFQWIPEVGDKPLVADMSSSILSRPLDVSRFGVIYAGAQKNIGPAGICIAIVRKDLLDRERPETPVSMSYKVAASNGSMYNTPPTYAWYLSGLVFKWLKAQGGLEAMGEVNKRKAAQLYAAIDGSDFYNNPIALDSRSLMNIPFTLADDRLNDRFLAEAEEAGLLNLQGHRSVGGMRASIYNAVPESAVKALTSFMAEFEKRHA